MSDTFKFPTPDSITKENTLGKAINPKQMGDYKTFDDFQRKIKESRDTVATERIQTKDGIKNCVKEIAGIDKQIEEAKKLVENLNQQREVLAKRGLELMEKLSAINPEPNYTTPVSIPKPNPEPNLIPAEPCYPSNNFPIPQPQPISQSPGQEPKIPKTHLGPAFQSQPELKPIEPTMQKPTEPKIPQTPTNPAPTTPNNIFGFPQGYQLGQDNKGPRPIPNFKGENLMPNPPHPATNFTLEK